MLNLGVDENGRGRRPKAFGRTRTEVRTRLGELRTASEAGQAVDRRTVNFAPLADEWLEKGLPADAPHQVEPREVDLRPGDIEAATMAGMAAAG